MSAAAATATAVALDDTDLVQRTTRRASLGLLPFLFILDIGNYLDRTNVAMARVRARKSQP